MCRPDDYPPYEDGPDYDTREKEGWVEHPDEPEEPMSEAEAAYYAQLEEDAARADERRRRRPPVPWGTPMPNHATYGPGYFCEPCWRSGDKTGFHPHSLPPCDPVYGMGFHA